MPDKPEPNQSIRLIAPAILITAAIAIIFIALPFVLKFHNIINLNLEDLDHIGSYVSSIVGVTTIVWLIIAATLQVREFSLQRQELALQREVTTDTSVAFQAQLAINVYQVGLHSLGALARDICTILIGKDDDSIKSSEILFSSDPASFIRLIQDNNEIISKINLAYAQKDIIIHLIDRYIEKSDSLERLLLADRIPDEVYQYLYRDNPVSHVNEMIKSIKQKIYSR